MADTPKSSPKRDEVSAFLLSEYSEGRIPTGAATALRFNISRPYVHMIRADLVRMGKLPVSPRGRGGAPDNARLARLEQRERHKAQMRIKKATIEAKLAATAQLREEPLAQVMENITSGKSQPMSTAEKRTFLSELARLTMREEIKVQAISALNRLDATVRIEEDLGPGPPKTPDECDTRLIELLTARKDVFGRTEALAPRS